MSSFGEQLRAAQAAHLAASALESSVRQQISNTFDEWDQGKLNAQTVRYRLESIVRTAYRSSAAVAAAHTAREAGIPGWTPVSEIFSTEYLAALLKDLRRNLRDYKASAKEETDRRRAVLRIQHGAGVAAQRGYTDALIASYSELEGFGYVLRKVWMANFVNNVPCDHCRALHGTEVGLHEEFPAPTLRKLKIYHNLIGPPRHPRCRCYLAILIVSLENAFEKLDIQRPTPAPQTMSTDEVKRMPGGVFKAVVMALQKIISFVRGS